MTLSNRSYPFFLATLALCVPSVWAQMRDNREQTLACEGQKQWNNRLVNHCEIKEQTLPASGGKVTIDPGTNGGLTVKGWTRTDVLVRARIDTAAPSDVEAKSMVGQIRFASGAASLKAEGPASDHDHNWSVTYEVFVPQQTDIDAKAHNGGIRIQDVKGRITFAALNGGTHLSRLAGEVSGHTTNGGLTIELMGASWDGKGMDVGTTNGGVKMSVPANYSAHVETATVNGGIHVDFPVTVKGKLSKEMAFDLGSGGPTIRAVTTNGGVKITKT